MRRIKTNDEVLVIAGRDKGQKGKVLRVLEGGKRLLVEKVNLVKKHQKPTQKHPQGGIVEKEAPIHASNVMPVTDGGPFRVANKRLAKSEGVSQSVRVNRKTGEELE